MKLSFLKKIDKNTALVGIAAVAIVIVGVLVFGSSNQGAKNFSLSGIFSSSAEKVAKNAIDYINNNQLSDTPATLVSFSTESGLVKMKIKIGESEFDSYATRDGKLLFPQAFQMAKKTDGDNSNNGAQTGGKTAEEIIAAIKKSDKPELEAFIVSRCPFGIQMQRMVYEAVKNIPDLSQYIAIKYIGSVSSDGKNITAMHGEAEAKENLRQICIREEQSNKYWPYVACQMKAGDTAGCEKSAGVDSAKLNSCMADSSRGVVFAKKDFDSANKYNVSGSPTLAINGALVEEFTSDNKPVFGSSRSADEIKSIVCEAFNNKAGFCSTKLNANQAATSFSEAYENSSASANANADCGN